MIWTIITIVIGTIIIFITSPTSKLVDWFLNRFAVHPKLDPNEITVTFNGKRLKEEEKNRFSYYFNEAHYVKRNHIFPGTEKSFLQPETAVTPFVINVKSGKKEMNFFLYHYDDHVDVVKQWKKKVSSFTISSEPLQNFSISVKA
ncbi:YfmQ family protein [Sporosarcina highlanderae]|uniref:YfmQ family protein n=1 Tax=Sporosarcina highlanderae TaxID=3035916 RepID=A0ABT8JSL4_9BACL|nr:YfmQ family protein [Sporosarcina highlanderae]MDN4608156.1 YfmQ family protein [Sporosarcina highlanderae]